MIQALGFKGGMVTRRLWLREAVTARAPGRNVQERGRTSVVVRDGEALGQRHAGSNTQETLRPGPTNRGMRGCDSGGRVDFDMRAGAKGRGLEQYGAGGGPGRGGRAAPKEPRVDFR